MVFKTKFSAVGDIRRLRQIVAVLAKHGLGGFVAQVLPNLLPRRIRSQQTPVTSMAPRLRAACEELGPAFVKLGQILATRVDIFPAEWTEALSALQNGADPMPFAEVAAILQQKLPQQPEALFTHIEETPVGSASIAQVHRAFLYTGEEVAVKIKRPDIEPMMQADLRILTHLAQLIESEIVESRRYRPVQMVQYFAKSLAEETDLAAELRAQQRFERLYHQHPFIRIPQAHADCSNRDILIQQYIAAPALKDLQVASLPQGQARLLAERLTDALLDMILQKGVFHADPHPGNILVHPDGSLSFIDFGLVGYLGHTRRMELTALLEALIDRDAFTLQYVLSAWTENGDMASNGLGSDIVALLQRYEHTALRDLDLTRVIQDLTAIMRQHSLILPPDLVLLFKTLITLEGVVKQLDGDFQLLEHAQPLIRKALFKQYNLSAWTHKLRSRGRLAARFLDSLPENLLRLSQRLNQGRFSIDLDLQRLDELNQHLDRTANRLTMGIVTAALIIGSSIVLASNTGPKLFGFAFFGFIGYLLAFANSLWIIWSIWRSGRH